jgi:superfamily II DNA or RNA helicase
MITIQLSNTKAKIKNLTDKAILKRLDDNMLYQSQAFRFMGNQAWDGKVRLFDHNQQFPIGLLSIAERILKESNEPYIVEDYRKELKYENKMIFKPDSKFVPRWYQKDIVDLAWKVGGGIVRAATGSGKTSVISMITARFGVKTVIYVIGIELLYQMKETIESLFPDIKVGMVGDGKCDIQDVTICTIWSAASAFGQKVEMYDSDLTVTEKNDKLNKPAVQRMIREAEMILFDECQYVASAVCRLISRESISARHRFCFSGTPWRDTGDDILIEAVGGPKFYDLDASKLIKDNVLVRPIIYFVSVKPMKNIGRTYHEVYSKFIVNNEDRNEKIISAADKLIAAGRKVLILVTKVEHGKILLDMLKEKYRAASLDGKNKTSERLASIKAMKDGELDVLIASKIFDQGVDIPQLDALILAGSGKSSGRALQRIGRVIRQFPGKKDAVVVDFFDCSKYLRDHSEARIKIYQTEIEFKIKLPEEFGGKKSKSGN